MLSRYVLEPRAGLRMWVWLVEAILGRKEGGMEQKARESDGGEEASLKHLLTEQSPRFRAASSRKRC